MFHPDMPSQAPSPPAQATFAMRRHAKSRFAAHRRFHRICRTAGKARFTCLQGGCGGTKRQSRRRQALGSPPQGHPHHETCFHHVYPRSPPPASAPIPTTPNSTAARPDDRAAAPLSCALILLHPETGARRVRLRVPELRLPDVLVRLRRRVAPRASGRPAPAVPARTRAAVTAAFSIPCHVFLLARFPNFRHVEC